MSGLNSVGKEVYCHLGDFTELPGKLRQIVMVIEAPRGQCLLYEEEFWPLRGRYEKHAEAIKAFMEQHRND